MWQHALNFVKPYYKQSHRFYHNFSHIENLLDYIEEEKNRAKNYEALAYAILFHDIVYEIGRQDNEEQSCEVYKQYYKTDEYLDLPHPDLVCPLIIATKNPFSYYENDDQLIVDADLSIASSSPHELLEYENNIFKEYQKFPINVYREKRIEFLYQLNEWLGYDNFVEFLIDTIKTRKYKIGLYAGSFQPYHIGHQNIVNKAEKLFDKVIVAKGYNRDKEVYKTNELSLINEVISYDGLVTNLFSTPIENVEYTMIRGLRNGYDLQYEDNLRKFIYDQNPNIQVVYIFCDRDYDHISSSMIRGLTEFGENVYRRYLP